MPRNEEFKVYKGLQKPLTLMGLQGRYIGWAAIGAGISFILFATFFALFGFWSGLAALVVCLGFFISLIAYKQRDGLFSKKRRKGDFIFCGIFKK